MLESACILYVFAVYLCGFFADCCAIFMFACLENVVKRSYSLCFCGVFVRVFLRIAVLFLRVFVVKARYFL